MQLFSNLSMVLPDWMSCQFNLMLGWADSKMWLSPSHRDKETDHDRVAVVAALNDCKSRSRCACRSAVAAPGCAALRPRLYCAQPAVAPILRVQSCSMLMPAAAWSPSTIDGAPLGCFCC
ncbi:hypothetical protein PVAP13_9KG546000 [Panicum virgatum]|uniref:Uncharacterized protein n=1 Tax=Panicum virgatum TaxID=38727 RepID=A0A8T0P348_PANVG|nr:hypothetical protein PVAP13_9KG546000 [Panicum virgatum]